MTHTHTHTHRHKNAPHTTSSSKFPTIAHERFYPPCAVTHCLHQHDGDDMLTLCLAHFLRACAANYNYCVVPESGEDAILFASFAPLMWVLSLDGWVLLRAPPEFPLRLFQFGFPLIENKAASDKRPSLWSEGSINLNYHISWRAQCVSTLMIWIEDMCSSKWQVFLFEQDFHKHISSNFLST